MNTTEREILVHLREKGDNIPSNIADAIDRHSGSVQRSIGELESRELVENKGRGVYTLTEKGDEASESLVTFKDVVSQ